MHGGRFGEDEMKKSMLILGFISLLFSNTLNAAPIINGGFEYGDFTGWETIGNAQIIDGNLESPSYHGDYYALLSTAGGVSLDELYDFMGNQYFGFVEHLHGHFVSASAIKATFTEEIQGFNYAIKKSIDNLSESFGCIGMSVFDSDGNFLGGEEFGNVPPSDDWNSCFRALNNPTTPLYGSVVFWVIRVDENPGDFTFSVDSVGGSTVVSFDDD